MKQFAHNPADAARYYPIPYCSFWVAGTPKATPRCKAVNRGRHAGVYTPATANDWKALVAIAAAPLVPAEPLDGPLVVRITFFFPRPQRLCRKKDFSGPIPMDRKPDRDNCEKAVLDILTQIGMWNDDSQVFDGPPRKFYHGIGARPGAHIAIFTARIGEPAQEQQ